MSVTSIITLGEDGEGIIIITAMIDCDNGDRQKFLGFPIKLHCKDCEINLKVCTRSRYKRFGIKDEEHCEENWQATMKWFIIKDKRDFPQRVKIISNIIHFL